MKDWSDESRMCQIDVLASRGKRIIIALAGSDSDWIGKPLCTFSKNKNSSCVDYHTNMTADLFENRFTNKLLRFLPAASVIIIDNTSYLSR